MVRNTLLRRGALWAAVFTVSLAGLCASASAQYVYYESFTGTSAPGWQSVNGGTSPGPRLTADATPNSSDPEYGAPSLDAAGNGWMRLASDTGNQQNIVAFNTAIPSNANSVTITFDFTMWGGSGHADGMSLFLFDGSQPLNVGANGGSLSYAQKSGVSGLGAAYVGIGLDTFGNFSSRTEGRTGAINDANQEVDPGFNPDQIVVRGPGSGQSGYNYLAGTGGKNYSLAGDPTIDSLASTFNGDHLYYDTQDFRPDQDAVQFRRFQVTLDENDQLTVSVEYGKNTGFVSLYTVDLSGYTRPDSLRIGFGGSTGGSREVIEVRNLLVSASGLDNTWYWTNATGSGSPNVWSNAANWIPSNEVPQDYGDVVFSDQIGNFQVVQPTTVTVDGADKTVGSLYFSGGQAYTISPDTNEKIILDASGHSLVESFISVTNSPNGNADHTLDIDLEAHNKVNVDNLVAQTLTIGSTGRTLALNSNMLEADSYGTTTIDSNITGDSSSSIVKQGTGTLNLYGSNSGFQGTIDVQEGILAVRQNNGLGDSGHGTTVEDGATLALDTLTPTTFDAEGLSLTGSGYGSQGALRNLQGDNTWTGTTTLNGSSVAIGADAGTTLTIQGGISGGADLIKVGAGTLDLVSSKTYTGNTIIRNGTLGVDSNGAMGNSTATVQLGDSGTGSGDAVALMITQDGTNISRNISVNDYGASATLGSSITSGTTQFSGDVALNRDTNLYADGSNLTTFSGTLSGTGGITKTGDGRVKLSGTNTFTGAAIIDAGKLIVTSGGLGGVSSVTIGDGTGSDRLILSGSGDHINDSAGVTINSSGIFKLNNQDETIASLTGSAGGQVQLGSGNLTLSGSASTTYAGNIDGTGTLTQAGTGVLTLSGANTLTGTLAINSGTVGLGASNVLNGSANVSLNGGTFATNGYNVSINNLDTTANSILDFVGGASDVTALGGTHTGGLLTIDNWSGTFGSAGSGGVDDRFIVDLGNWSYNQNTDIAFTGFGTGVQYISLGGSLYEVKPSMAGWYEWDGDSNSTWGTNANWVGNPAYPNSNSAQVLFGSYVTNNMTVDLGSNQTRTVRDMVINNNKTFTIGGGNSNTKLSFDTSSDTGTSYLTIIGSAAPTFSRAVYAQDNMNVANNSTGTVTFSGNVYLDGSSDSGARTLTFDGAGTTIVSGVISDQNNDDSIIKNGTGTLRLTGTNTYSGFTLNKGTVQVGNNYALGNAGTVTVNGGRFEVWNGDRTVNRSFDIKGDFSVGDAAGDSETTPQLTIGSSTLYGNRAVNVDSNTTFVMGTVGESGTSSFTKNGSGTLIFNGVNNGFSGGLIVNDGTVQTLTTSGGWGIGGSQRYLGSGDVTVNGGTVSSQSSDGGDFTIYSGHSLTNNGGTISIQSASSTSGTVTVGGQLVSTGGTTNLRAGSNFSVTGSVAASGGTVNLTTSGNYSQSSTGSLNVSGTGTVNVDLTSWGSNLNSTYTATNSTTTVNGSGAHLNIATEAGTTFNNGALNLLNHGNVEVTQGKTTLNNGVDLNGGSAATAGTLTVHGDLNIGQVDVANRPNITIDTNGSTQIAKDSGYAPSEISIINLGTITKNGTGTTTINSNINNIEASKIVINAGTLLLGDHNQLADSDNMTLASGTFATGGHSEVLNTLTLSTTSTIDMGNGYSILNYEGGGARTGGYLAISNWSGNISYGGGTDQVIFGESLSSTFLTNVYWVNQNIWGAVQLANGEIVPVPEARVIITMVLILGAIGWDVRRRRKNSAAA